MLGLGLCCVLVLWLPLCARLGLCCVLVLWLPLCARVGAMLCSCFVAPIVC